MKKILLLFFAILVYIFQTNAQSIPYGTSQDSVEVYPGEIHYLHYYKPLNYDPINSPIIFAIHGLGMTGNSEINDLYSIADRRFALIVAPDMHSNWASGTDLYFPDSSSNCVWWYPKVLNKIYKHILERESRDSISSYLIGFSAGGQFVTRYMLIRQGVMDSIPFIMAVSTNPYFYTFCTATLSGQDMFYPCGLKWGIYNTPNCNPNSSLIPLPFACDEHVLQYYNENYAVLIGSADTAINGTGCELVQGANRYERAQNFYHFSDSDAVARGTTLKWQYGEVPGVGHDENLMYNTILAGDSMPLAERLLFETPYHTVPNLAPHADFTADTTIVTLPGATVQFYNNSINATDFQWDFGDSTTSILFSPSHTYMYVDTFTVTLTSTSGTGCENILVKAKYIIVQNPTDIESINANNTFNLYPNPAKDKLTIESLQKSTIEILNVQGQKITQQQLKQDKTDIDISGLAKGLYILKLNNNDMTEVTKFLKE